MTFNEVIDKFMLQVESGSKEPFMIYRDESGSWHGDFTQNQYGDTLDWVENVKDPLAVTTTGYDMEKGSFPHVYDRIFNNRLRAEYETAVFPNSDPKQLKALINMVEDNIGELSGESTDYLATQSRPLMALYEMTTMSLASYDTDYGYNRRQVSEFVGAVETEISKRQQIHNSGYAELGNISINGSDIILSENPGAKYRYMVVENRYTQYYNDTGNNNIYTGQTNDYIEAISEFAQRVKYNADCVQSRREVQSRSGGTQQIELNGLDCLPDSHGSNFTDKLIIVKAGELKPDYRSSEHQLFICSHGNGARPNARGASVFGKELHSGESVCYGRHQIAGIANPDKLPDWAVKKIALTKAIKEPPLKEQSKKAEVPAKKPTLKEKMETAKEKVREADTANPGKGSKSKSKRDERE